MYLLRTAIFQIYLDGYLYALPDSDDLMKVLSKYLFCNQKKLSALSHNITVYVLFTYRVFLIDCGGLKLGDKLSVLNHK